MKKLVFSLLVLMFFAIGAPVFAQPISPENSSEYYYVRVDIERIFPTRYGYLIQHSKGINNMGQVCVPLEWFEHAAGKAEILTLPGGKNWPYMSIFYKNGEFSHIRIFVHRWRGHSTWGNMPMSANISGLFENKDTLEISFK